ncbi:MAG: hypothetical protein ABR587_07300 [Candidatus Binatia bacterium]
MSRLLLGLSLLAAVIVQPVLSVAEASAQASRPIVPSDSGDFEPVHVGSIMLGVFPSAPIASLTLHMIAKSPYGGDDPSCRYFGSGLLLIYWSGEQTLYFAGEPGGLLDRSQALIICDYYTQWDYSPLIPDDSYPQVLYATDAGGNDVPVELCILDHDEDGLRTPGPDDCHHACGDAVCDGGQVTVVDALAILKSAVGGSACSPAVCDPTGDGAVTASDALVVLRSAVGIHHELLCSAPVSNCY